MKFKIAAAPSWIYNFCPFWSNDLFPVAAVYISAKFHSSTSICGWVIAVCATIQDAAAAILNYNFVMLDHPRRPFFAPEIPLQISCWSSAYFSRYRNSKILQIWFKMPIQAPKIMFFWEFWPLNIFYHRDPKRPYLTRKHAFWAINGRDRSSVVTCRREQVYKKG